MTDRPPQRPETPGPGAEDSDFLKDQDQDQELGLELDQLQQASADGAPDGMYEHYRVVADRGQQPLRVDKFLVAHLPSVSRNRLQQAAEAGCVLIDGVPAKSNRRVRAGETVTVVMDRPRYDHEVVPQDIPLDIVYEDPWVLVVNKAAGMVVHPGHGNWDGTLVNALAWHLRDLPDYDVSDPRMGLVHRIDKDTSGLLVVAKTPQAKTCLGRQFFMKTTRRRYQALVWGIPQPPAGRIEGNIGRCLSDRLRMDVFPPDSGVGKSAVTHYEVLEPLAHVSLVGCVLETGRTHQIRAHMRHIGHPLFADARYGGDQVLRGVPSGAYRRFVARCMEACPRQALHAATLGFAHPHTGEAMDFTAPMPPDMEALLERWRAYASAVAGASGAAAADETLAKFS